MILLTTLNSKYVHSSLALKYLYASVPRFHKQITLTEFTINNEDDYIFSEMVRGEYSLICFSCYIWNVEKTLYLCQNIKKAQPQVKILLGGPEVSFHGARFLQEHPEVDFILSGEGEASFPIFVEEFLKGDGEQDYSSVPALSYRRVLSRRILSSRGDEDRSEDEDRSRKDRSEEILVNEALEPDPFYLAPFPYEYLEPVSDKVVYYESTRGCPYSCSYCLSSLEKSVRPLPLERVKKEMDYFLKRNVKQVKLIDRTFNYDSHRSEELFSYLIEKDNGITNFHFEICADLLAPSQLKLLERARDGLFQFEIGIQSTNEEALAACGRRCDFEALSRNVNRLREMGNIHLHLDLIAGLPHEDYISFRRSFNQVYQLKPHMLQLGFLKLLHGTPIRQRSEEYGFQFRSKAPYEVICNNFLTSSGLIRLKMIENVLDLYYNRGGYANSLDYAVREAAETAFDFYEELSSFYYLKGHQHRSHRKEDLYRILYSYSQWKGRTVTGFAERMKELLAGDMRETLNFDAVKKFERKGWEMTI